MAAREIYKNAAGRRLPSVTTIIGRFKESGGLIHWANQQGLDGKTLDAARAPAADAGTLAHAMVEADINGWPPPEMSGDVFIDESAQAAFDAYQLWKQQTRLRILHTEVSLVSEKLQVGGRLDAVGISGERDLCLIDWKTGSLYADHLLQVAAYMMLWDETYPDRPITGGAHLCRFNREFGDFGHSYFPDLENEKNAFRQMRQLYDSIKTIERRAR